MEDFVIGALLLTVGYLAGLFNYALFSANHKDDGWIKDGDEWIKVSAYLEKYCPATPKAHDVHDERTP